MAKKIVRGGSRTTLWVIVASLVIGGGIIFWGYQNAQTLPGKQTNSFSSGELAMTESTYDFGEVSMAKGLVNHEFVLSNTSSAPVKVGPVETTCMCTTAYLKVGEGKEAGPFGMPGHGGPRGAANLTVFPGEKLIVVSRNFSEKNNEAEPDDNKIKNSNETIPNYEKWWNYFFKK